MTKTEKIDYILSRVQQDLEKHGFRQCKSRPSMFFRFFYYRKICYAIEMKRSSLDYIGDGSFTFNLACVSYFELPEDYPYKNLKLSTVKNTIGSISEGAERIGHICRNKDYWWDVSDDSLNEFTIDDFYDKYIHDDIEKSAAYLKDLAYKKSVSDIIFERQYKKIYM